MWEEYDVLASFMSKSEHTEEEKKYMDAFVRTICSATCLTYRVCSPLFLPFYP